MSIWCIYILESHIGVAWRLKKEIPNSHILDQVCTACVCIVLVCVLLFMCVYLLVSSPWQSIGSLWLYSWRDHKAVWWWMFVLSLSLFFIFIKYTHKHTHMITGQLDMVIIGAGTGGTVTGIGRKMKEKLPNVEVSVHSLTDHVSITDRLLLWILLVLFWLNLKSLMILLFQPIRYFLVIDYWTF